MTYQWVKPKNNSWMVAKKTTLGQTGEDAWENEWYLYLENEIEQFGQWIEDPKPLPPTLVKGSFYWVKQVQWIIVAYHNDKEIYKHGFLKRYTSSDFSEFGPLISSFHPRNPPTTKEQS